MAIVRGNNYLPGGVQGSLLINDSEFTAGDPNLTWDGNNLNVTGGVVASSISASGSPIIPATFNSYMPPFPAPAVTGADGIVTLTASGGVPQNVLSTSTFPQKTGSLVTLTALVQKSVAASNFGFVIGTDDTHKMAFMWGSTGKCDVYYSTAGGSTFVLISSSTAAALDTLVHLYTFRAFFGAANNYVNFSMSSGGNIVVVDNHVLLGAGPLNVWLYADTNTTGNLYGYSLAY